MESMATAECWGAREEDKEIQLRLQHRKRHISCSKMVEKAEGQDSELVLWGVEPEKIEISTPESAAPSSGP